MKKLILATFVGLTLASVGSAQNIIAYWNQNSNNLLTDPVTFGYTTASFPQGADVGSGTLTLGNFNAATTQNASMQDVYSYIQSFAGSTVNALDGVGSGGSFSPQGGLELSNNGMYFDLNVSTLGYSGITLSWSQRGTAAGFTSRALSYSVDGGAAFTPVETDSGALGSTFLLKAFDMSAVAALDNAASVIFRVTLDGATNATGNNRFDNILVVAAVPEPATIAALLGLAALGFVMWRRRR